MNELASPGTGMPFPECSGSRVDSVLRNSSPFGFSVLIAAFLSAFVMVSLIILELLTYPNITKVFMGFKGSCTISPGVFALREASPNVNVVRVICLFLLCHSKPPPCEVPGLY